MKWIRTFLLSLLVSLLVGLAIGTWIRLRLEKAPVYIGQVGQALEAQRADHSTS